MAKGVKEQGVMRSKGLCFFAFAPVQITAFEEVY